MLVVVRFWWTPFHANVGRYMQPCDTCQRMQNTTQYRTGFLGPQSSLFDVLWIDFAGPFLRTHNGYRYLLFCVEHLTEWPIVRATMRATAEEVLHFMEKKFFPRLGAPKTIFSNNAACFPAQNLQNYMEEQGPSAAPNWLCPRCRMGEPKGWLG